MGCEPKAQKSWGYMAYTGLVSFGSSFRAVFLVWSYQLEGNTNPNLQKETVYNLKEFGPFPFSVFIPI